VKKKTVILLEVAPGDVEIYVDGRFIGLARDFKEAARVSVPSGNHIMGFKYGGSSSSTRVYVAPGSTSVVRGEFKSVSGSLRGFSDIGFAQVEYLVWGGINRGEFSKMGENVTERR
jgi:hypothetical protein